MARANIRLAALYQEEAGRTPRGGPNRTLVQKGTRNMESNMSAVAESKPFRRSRTDRWSAGILGGLAEHLELDSYLVRAAFVALAVFTALVPCMVLYIALWVIIPERMG